MGTTIHTALALAARLARQAEDDGIAVDSVSTSTHGSGSVYIQVYAADEQLAPALAVSLGLTSRSVHEHDGVAREHFRGEIEGAQVTTHGPLPLAVVVDTDTAEVLTKPMPRDEAESVARHNDTRHVHVEAVTR